MNEIDFDEEESDFEDITVLIKKEFQSTTISYWFNGDSDEKEIEDIIVYNKKI